MDRLTGKDAQLMMEAVANVYEKKGDCVDKSKKTKHNCAKKVCSEQWGEGTCVPEHHTLLEDGTVTHYDVVFEHGVERMVPVEELEILVTEMHEHAAMEGELVLENDEYEKLDENLLQLLTRNRTVYRRDPKTGEKIKVDQQRDPKNLDKYVDKKTTGTKDYGYRDKKPGEAGDGTMGSSVRRTRPKTDTAPAASTSMADKKPANPNVTKDGTKFERRLPTMAELRAAQAARKAAAAAGKDKAGQESAAVKAGVGEGQRKPPTAPPPVSSTKPAMSGPGGYTVPSSAKPQANLGAKNPMSTPMTVSTPSGSNTYKPGERMSTADTATMKAAQQQFRPKPTGSAAGSAAKPAAAAPAPVVKKKPAMGARNRMRMEEVDIFDTIKEYLIGEGATEEEALKQMLTLTDEQRTEIIEGSCGSKKKKKSKKGGY